ncbi:hypothetical protein [Sphingomonas sp.]|uniref:hypothetical protein n=1 Tax=Sphingomonas sp. TaxID=28214 RepID=UPI001EC29FBD|nr:hypothetical protein [Sphingomonas sp.]MBX3594188.1 hypothetical protein [Sphingomonas sp.]
MRRTRTLVFGLAGAFALAMPAALLSLSGAGETKPGAVASARPIVPPPVPAIGAVYERPVFAAADAAGDAPADAPALLGIAGRIDRDAVAMVRGTDGRTRTLSPGESVDGWRLESLAIDAAFFTRGGARVRVAMQGEDGQASDGRAGDARDNGDAAGG